MFFMEWTFFHIIMFFMKWTFILLWVQFHTRNTLKSSLKLGQKLYLL